MYAIAKSTGLEETDNVVLLLNDHDRPQAYIQYLQFDELRNEIRCLL